MPEPFLVAKALDVSGSALGKSTSVVIKGLLVLGVIALLIWGGYVTFVKPHTNPTPTERADSITHNHFEPKCTFGCGGCLRIDKGGIVGQ